MGQFRHPTNGTSVTQYLCKLLCTNGAICERVISIDATRGRGHALILSVLLSLSFQVRSKVNYGTFRLDENHYGLPHVKYT